MSMAVPLWPLLYLLLVPSTWAGPPSTVSLPPALQSTVPTCAQSCLGTFIAESFPSFICGPPLNFGCLCTRNSTSGFTIGEGALECLYASCEDVSESQAGSVYGVCLTIPNAIPNLHGTLTANILPAASTTGATSTTRTSVSSSFLTSTSSSSKSSSSPSVASSTSSGVTSTITSSSSSSFRSSSSTLEPTRSSTSPAGGIIPPTTSRSSSATSTATATAAPASSPAPTLSKPQIAGVVVASIGATAIALGLCFLVLCLRRKRSLERRRSGSSFGGDKIIDSEETSPDLSAIAARDFEYEQETRQQALPRRPRSPTRQLRLETPATSSEDGWGQYQKDMAPEQASLEIGPSIPRSLRDDHSPITPVSNRTRNSQLLPDKPSYSLFPPPLRATPRNSIPNQVIRSPGRSPRPPVPPLGSPFARPAPEHPSSVDTSQANLQGGSTVMSQHPDPFTDASNRSPPAIYSHFQESRPRPPPRSTRRGPPAFRVPSWEQPPSGGVVRKPVPTYHPYRPQEAAAARDGEQDYAAVENPHRRKPSRMKSSASRRTTIFSNGSETSFETHEDEDDEIPDSRSMLPPVAEVRSPPTGRVGYPAIPVSASESPTRRTRERSIPPSETDSLLSKRLGPDKAKEIAGRLRGPAQQSEDDSTGHSAKWKILVSPGLRGIDRSVSPPSTKSTLKSPPTPWRR